MDFLYDIKYRCKTLRRRSPRSSFTLVPDRREIIETLRRMEQEFRDKGVEGMHLFGSTARGDATFDSDVDIAFATARKFSLLEQWDLDERLEGVFGRPVDLVKLPFEGRLKQCAEEDLVPAFQ